MITIRRRSHLDDTTTEIDAHPVREGGTEIVIKQSTFKHLRKRYAPSKLVLFTLSTEDKARLITMLQGGVV